MKRTRVASAIAITLGITPVVQAGTAGLTGAWSGEYIFGFCSACGGWPMGINLAPPTSPQNWTFDFDNGTVDIVNTETFYGSVWTAHDVTFSDNGDGTYSGIMLWDWNDSTAHIDLTWDISDTGEVLPIYALITANSPVFPGFTPVFVGTISAVPIPGAVWLFGSGLLSLVSMARRKNA